MLNGCAEGSVPSAHNDAGPTALIADRSPGRRAHSHPRQDATFAPRATPIGDDQAACASQNGWACPAIERSTKFKVNSSGIPASWTIPQWYVDNSNATGCASDSNTCTHDTCGGTGIGPCAHYKQLVSRWGTECPIFQQQTNIKFLSSQTDGKDPVNLCMTRRGFLAVYEGAVGPAQVVGTGTLSGVVPKNYTTNTALQAVLPLNAQRGSFLINATHPSVAFAADAVSSDGGANTWIVTQPMGFTSPYVGPLGGFDPPEVDTWANGDAVTMYDQVKIQLGEAVPQEDGNDVVYDGGATVGGTAQSAVIYRIQAVDFVSPQFPDALNINRHLMFAESVVRRWVVESGGGSLSFTHMNNWFDAGYHRVGVWWTGLVAGGVNINNGPLGGNDLWFDADLVIIGTTQVYTADQPQITSVGNSTIQHASFGDFYIGAGVTVSLAGGPQEFNDTEYTVSARVYGPGTLDIMAKGYLHLATYMPTTRITIGSSTTACSSCGSVDGGPLGDGVQTVTCGIPIDNTHFIAPCGATGFGQHAFRPGLGTISWIAPSRILTGLEQYVAFLPFRPFLLRTRRRPHARSRPISPAPARLLPSHLSSRPTRACRVARAAARSDLRRC